MPVDGPLPVNGKAPAICCALSLTTLASVRDLVMAVRNAIWRARCIAKRVAEPQSTLRVRPERMQRAKCRRILSHRR